MIENMAYAHKRICSLSSDFVVVKMKRAKAEKRAFDSKSGYNTNTNVLKSLHNSLTPPVLCCLFLLTGFSPGFLKLPSFARTETRGGTQIIYREQTSVRGLKAQRRACPVCRRKKRLEKSSASEDVFTAS